MKTSDSRSYINLKIWIIPVLALCVAGVSLFFLPESIPMQWGSNGQVNYYGSKYMILLWPVLGAALLLLGNIVPVLDPKGNQYEKFGKEYNLIHLLLLLFLLAMEVVTVLVSLGVQLKISVLVPLFMGAILAVVGNFLPRIRQNYLTGIKTIWGYQNERVWNKTQRMAGRIWFGCGVLMMLFAFFPWGHVTTLILIVVLLLVPRFYSYIQYEKEQSHPGSLE